MRRFADTSQMHNQEMPQARATAAVDPRSRVRQDPSAVHGGFGLDSGFLIAYLLCVAIVLVLLPIGGKTAWAEAVPALALQLIVAVLLGLSRRKTQPHRSAAIVGIVAYLLSVALLRDGAGPTGGYGPLVLLPVVWAALQGRRVELGVAVVGVAVVFFLPTLLIGAPNYPAGGWRAGMLLAVLAAATGFAIMRLLEGVSRLVHKLEALASRDELTGLPNKRAWQELFEHELATSTRLGEPLTVALLDLDSFKQYNDEHGHLAGDRLLSDAAAAWHGALRDTDVLARWGGDEFGLLLPRCTQSAGEEIAARMRASLPEVRFSVGVVEWDGLASADELLASADAALYRSKRGDPDSVAVLAP
jgi:diguanylate cyclase (GGDEF)-like protein